MKAVGLYRYLPIDDPESLLDLELPAPVAGGRDLLVAVRAVSVNPVDYKMRGPKDQVETTPRILGWDVAGVVQAVGPQVTLFKPGDAVYYAGARMRQGGNSELHLVDERIVGRKPASLDFAAAAALPLTTLTAWEGMFERIGISKDGAHAGRTILVIGGAGGVGSIAIQLAKQLARLTVIATASRPESSKWARELGADHVVDHSKDLAAQLAALGTPEVDYVLVLSNIEPYVAAFPAIVAPQGKICAIVGTATPLDLGPLMAKSVTFAWELMFTRPQFETADMSVQHEILEQAAALVDTGVLRTTMTENLGAITAANLKRAHRALEGGRVIGKLVLAGFPA
ncbi:MAG: zinc-binding alcohol dehydrogenase family protein [Candidatus Rokubacteria bacterium]|nr:zinc-binding alcohol dehydrogenase family protein [Candidatus Rokubacteria bacterium]